MKLSELDKQLLVLQQQKIWNWGKLINILKRHFDAWATAQLAAHGYEDFKMGYMPLLMNIHPEGITNNELAKKAKVTKQAMSKVVKELIEGSYIETEVHGTDRRSTILFLTQKGKKLVITAKSKVLDLEKEYEAVLGKRKFEELKNLLFTLANHHEKVEGTV